MFINFNNRKRKKTAQNTAIFKKKNKKSSIIFIVIAKTYKVKILCGLLYECFNLLISLIVNPIYLM